MYSELGYDPAEAIAHLSDADSILGAMIHAVGPYGVKYSPMHSLFHALSRSIVYQQLSGKAAGTIHGRFLGLFDDPENPTPAELLKIETEALRAVGLSGAKTRAIQDLAQKSVSRELPEMEELHSLSNEEIISSLTRVRGIGPWTVQMFLMFRLGRPDVMPATDLGIRKGFALTYGLDDLPDAAEILEHSDVWRPFRTVASWYLWRSLELEEIPG